MWSGKKPIPEEGMQVKHIEYEIEHTEKEGKTYENYNIKKFELSDNASAQAIPNAKEDQGPIPQAKNDREVSFYVSYIKDIAVAIIENGGNLETADLDSIAKRIGKAGLIMMYGSLNSAQISSQDSEDAPESTQEDKPVPTDTQKQADKELRATLKTYARKNNDLYFKTLGLHGASKAEEVIGFEEEAQASLLKDLDKAFADIPF